MLTLNNFFYKWQYEKEPRAPSAGWIKRRGEPLCLLLKWTKYFYRRDLRIPWGDVSFFAEFIQSQQMGREYNSDQSLCLLWMLQGDIVEGSNPPEAWEDKKTIHNRWLISLVLFIFKFHIAWSCHTLYLFKHFKTVCLCAHKQANIASHNKH